MDRSHRFAARAWLLLALGAAAAATALLGQERELLLVAGPCLALPPLAALWVLARRIRLAGTLVARPGAIEVGATGDLVLTLTSAGWLPTTSFVVVPRAPVLPGGQGGVPVTLPLRPRLETPLRAGQPRLLELTMHARARGAADVPAPVIRFADPFGLFRSDHVPCPPCPVVVLPPVVELAGLPLGVGRGRRGHGAGGTGDPDATVRPYVAGDDIRTIHWRASARLEDALMVRTRESGGSRSVALVLDDRPAAHVGPGLEVAVAFAASVGVHMRREHLPLSVSDAAGQVLVDGEEDADRLLDALARVGSGGDRFAPEAPGRPDLVLAFLGARAGPAETAWLGRLATAGIAFAAGGLPVALPGGWRGVTVDLPETDDAASPLPPEELRRLLKAAWDRAVAS